VKKQQVIGVALIIACLNTSAEIYKWTDDKGIIHYSDAKPADDTGKPAPKVEEVQLSPITIMQDGTVNNTNNETLGLADKLKNSLQDKIAEWKGGKSANTGKHTVDIYTTPWCGYCQKAKSWLRENRIPFKEYNIESDKTAAQRMKKLGGNGGIPFTVIDGKTVQGFNVSAYQSLLQP
jgi:glutaredoxin